MTNRTTRHAGASVDDATTASIARLRRLAELQFDWNSYGGLPPSDRAIEQSIEIVRKSAALAGEIGGPDCKPGAIAPLPDGGVSMLWKGPGGELDLEVSPLGEIGFLFEPAGDASSRTIDRDNVSIRDVLSFVRMTLDFHSE